jgi:hypothetical protein
MFESNTSTFECQNYTTDLIGLATHARDTLGAYAHRASAAMGALRIELPRSRVGPTGRHYSEYHVPDSVRVR